MKKLFLLCLAISLSAADLSAQHAKTINQVDFSQVTINDSFWAPRLTRHAATTLPVCIDQIENKTGRMQNFINAAKGSGAHSGIFYDDSDVYKAMEGMAYSLIVKPDASLEAKLDEWVDNIAGAQQADGYINTFFTLTDNERWKDMDKHEMYCAGHLIEAGIAYYKARGKRKLLDVGQRMADHMMSVFGPDKRHWVAGHEEVELSLVKLYEVTGEQKYLDFAYWLLEERGHGYGTKGGNGSWNKTYYQDAVPVKDLKRICGHAVRAMYLFCGMADVASYLDGTNYMEALDELWHSTVDRNMYVTGGIGSSAANEGFTQDYDLPNKSAYCETCASVGMVLWNHRMNMLTGDSKYADILERSLYNGLLAGINIAGNRFFYVNPLESDGNHHREAWFGTACCPSNLSRFLPSLGTYIYGTSENNLWVNLYIGNKAEFELDGTKLGVTMDTEYPWDGSVSITLDKAISGKQVRLRIPEWCKNYSVKLGDATVTPDMVDGYAVVTMNSATTINLVLDMPVERVEADKHVLMDMGKRAIQRGPLVYCAEAADNNGNFENFEVGASTDYTTEMNRNLGGFIMITANNNGEQLKLIPYYAWDNRTAGKMLVWLKSDDYTARMNEFNLQPTYSIREQGYQYGNIMPIDLKNDGQKQMLIGAWYKYGYGEGTTRFSALLQKDGNNWTDLGSPFNIADRPSFSPCDINGDGIMDIVMVEQTGNSADGIYLGNGDGTFTKLTVKMVDATEGLPSNYNTPINNMRTLMSADVADFNNDGLLDIVGIGFGESPTVVLLNQGIDGKIINLKPIYFDNGITDPARDVINGKPYPSRNFSEGMVFAADFNNDGFADILVSSDNMGRQNYDADWERFTEVYLNNGDGTSFSRTYFARALDDDNLQNPSVSNGGVAIADFNGDGYLDIFLQGPGGYFSYYWDHTFVVINDGTGHFAPLTSDLFDRLDIRNQNSVSNGAQAYDWNGDGLIDIIYEGVCPTENTQTGYIWLNGDNGREGAFLRSHRWAGGSESASAIIDWDGDGRKDLVNTGWCGDYTFLDDNNNTRTMTVTLNSETATEAPLPPTNLNAEVNNGKVTLSWTPAANARKNTTYELYFKNEKGQLLGNPRAYLEGEREGQRKCEEFGKLGCVTSITYTLPEGDYEWGVQAVDGRRMGSTFAKSTFKVGETGIAQVENKETVDTPYYTIDGRRLAGKPVARGIYLHSGKKYVK